MKAKNALFWLVYVILCVWGQRLIPGVDFFAPGVLHSLQEERGGQTLWLTLAVLFIHEGTGTLVFGAALLWYTAVIVVYFIGRWLFDAGNILFVSLMGLVLGCVHFGLLTAMQSLQATPATRPDLLLESLIQALAFPLIWIVLRILRKDWVARGDTA